MKEIKNSNQNADRSGDLPMREESMKSWLRRLCDSRWFTIPVGMFAGSFIAAIAAECLIVFCLTPPMSHWFGMDGEFDVLALGGVPIMTLPVGLLAGLVFGVAPRWRHSVYLASTAGCLPAVGYFVVAAWQPTPWKRPWEQFVSTGVCAICIMLGTILSIGLLNLMFRYLSR